MSLSYIMGFDNNIIHWRIKTTRLHTSRCQHYHFCILAMLTLCYCIDVTRNTNPLLSHIHVSITLPLHMMCTLVATARDSTEVRVQYTTLRATSHTRLRARDQITPSTLIGGKGGAGPSSLHTTLEGPNRVCECKMDVTSTWIPTWHEMDHVSWSLGLFPKTASWR